jgi:hypothetical protein
LAPSFSHASRRSHDHAAEGLRVATPGSAILSAVAVCLCLVATWVAGFLSFARGEDRGKPPASASRREPTTARGLLSPEQWHVLDRAVDKGLHFLSSNQESDGSFATEISAQPGVTSLCIMAFLARGHQPGKGPYGSQIERAIDYVLDMQEPHNGALMADRWAGPNFDSVRRISDGKQGSFAGNYNHGIAGVMLGEVYGMTDAKRHERIRQAILKALAYTRKQQSRPKLNPRDRGGWRYVHVNLTNDSDLSVTAWQLMFLRSARNAEFNVPKEWAQEAMDYVHRTFDVEQRGFVYALAGDDHYCSRGMVGAGVVCLALGGEHRSETAKVAGDWILQRSFEPYNNSSNKEDRYHYGAFYCSQAMFQLGGDYWHGFFPKLLHVLTEAQHANGSWDAEEPNDGEFGTRYTTALAVLALATPYQLLPIYQR